MCSNKKTLILLIWAALIELTLQHLLTIAQGRLRGVVQDGYISYIGIPYASVVGNVSRFKRAGLAPVWTDVRESRDPRCTAASPAEDCLQLDVHVPNIGSELPVLVWIKGSSGDYHPGMLVAQGIIVVVVRHRLGPLGFLCSKAEKIAGNAGIKDTLLALRWVKDNIIAFKGTPHRVILGGQGFGAAMVEALLLLPSSNKLYHGAILQSGSILCPWTFNYDAEDRAKALKSMLNSSIDQAASITKAEASMLAMKAEKLTHPYMPFGICVEKPSKHEESVMLETPYHLFLKGKMISVPLLMGYNSNEAYVFAQKLMDARVTSKMKRDMTFLLPEELQNISKAELVQVKKQMNDMYFSDNMSMVPVLSYHRDVYFVSHIHRSLRFHASTDQSVYYYQFSYSGTVGITPEPGMSKEGAAHSDELGYLFPRNGRELSDDDGLVQRHLIRLWTNFVKHLDPTPDASGNVKWDPTTAHQPRLLNIDTEPEMMDFPHSRAAQLWESVYEKHYYMKNPDVDT